MTQPKAGSLFTRSFLFLSLADVAYFTGGGMLVTATPLFVTDRLGGGDTGVGLAFGAFSVATLVLRPWAGRWSDRWGRRLPMLVGTAAFAVITLGHLLVTGLVGLIALRLFLGAAEALFFVAGFAMLADIAPVGRPVRRSATPRSPCSRDWPRVPRWPRRSFGRQVLCQCGGRWPSWPQLPCHS